MEWGILLYKIIEGSWHASDAPLSSTASGRFSFASKQPIHSVRGFRLCLVLYMSVSLGRGDSGDDGVLEPSDDAEVVRIVFRFYATGQHSYATLADELNARGHRIYDPQTRQHKLFSTSNVRDILKNPVYVGKVKLKEEVLPGVQTPLMDERTWTGVQSILEQRGAKAGRVSLCEKRLRPTAH